MGFVQHKSLPYFAFNPSKTALIFKYEEMRNFVL